MSYPMLYSQAVSIACYIATKMRTDKTEYNSTRAISEYLGIPAPSVTKAIGLLVGAGILSSKEGAGGGVMLAKSEEEISLLSILQAVDTSSGLFKESFGRIADEQENAELVMAIRSAFSRAEKAMQEELRLTTLSTILAP